MQISKYHVNHDFVIDFSPTRSKLYSFQISSAALTSQISKNGIWWLLLFYDNIYAFQWQKYFFLIFGSVFIV